MRAPITSFVVAGLVACTSGLPFGAPCERDSECADGFVCDDDEEVCVPERDGEGDEGEGEGTEGEGEEGEGEEGEGEEGDVEVRDVTGDLTGIVAVAMDARDDFIAVAVVSEDDPITFRHRLDLCRIEGDGAPACDVVIADVGLGGRAWVSVAVDPDHTTWIAYNESQPSDTSMSIVAVDDGGAIVSGPVSLGETAASVEPRSDVTIAPSGVAAVAFKSADGSVNFATAPSFDPVELAAPLFDDQDLRRVALTFTDSGDPHVVFAHGNEGILHLFDQGSGFVSDSVVASIGTTTYIGATFADDGLLHSMFDFDPGDGSIDCESAWNGAAWSSCEELPIDFNSHSHAMTSLGNTLALAYYDASAEAPSLLRGDTQIPLDDTPFGGGLTTIALRGDGAIVVGYYAEGSDDDTDRARIAIVR